MLMLRNHLPTALLFLLAYLTVETDAFWLSPICNALLGSLDASCSCWFWLLGLSVDCSIDRSISIEAPPVTVSGTPRFQAGYWIIGPRSTSLTINLQDDVTFVPPDRNTSITTDVFDVFVDVGTGFNLIFFSLSGPSCTFKYGDEECQKCEICDEGDVLKVKPDCSNIVALEYTGDPPYDVTLPAYDVCIGV